MIIYNWIGVAILFVSLELGIDVPVHFHDFDAAVLVDKVVSDDVRLR
jgi:hypothetical protein